MTITEFTLLYTLLLPLACQIVATNAVPGNSSNQTTESNADSSASGFTRVSFGDPLCYLKQAVV